MYVSFGNNILDSLEISELIQNETQFNVITDLSKSTKREDMIAFHVDIDESVLKSVLEEDGYDIEEEERDEIINEYMELVDDLGTDIEEILPGDAIMSIYAYRYEEAEEKVKAILVITHVDLGERKLKDVLNRLLKQI